MDASQSIDCVGRAGALQLERTHAQARVVPDGKLAHPQAVLGARVPLGRLVRRDQHRRQQHSLQAQAARRRPCEREMADVGRIEHAAEDADALAGLTRGRGRRLRRDTWTCTALCSPIGPRAWSFCVELPISAPIPNSPPSVKRVEALTYTQAASTPSWNSRALAVSFVTIASECPEPWRAMCSIASSKRIDDRDRKRQRQILGVPVLLARLRS